MQRTPQLVSSFRARGFATSAICRATANDVVNTLNAAHAVDSTHAAAYSASNTAQRAAGEAVGTARDAAASTRDAVSGAARDVGRAVERAAPTGAAPPQSPPPPPPPAYGTVGQAAPRRRVGGFRGGLLGFFFGFSLASAYASYYLLQEYKLATSLLQGSVEELGESTTKMTTHLRRIEAVEKDLKALSAGSSKREDVGRLREEMKKVYDGLHGEVLDLRAHVWGVEQDLHKSASANSIRV